MLNNLNFIQLTLPKEATLSKMLEDSPEIIKGIYSEMNSLIEQYMKRLSNKLQSDIFVKFKLDKTRSAPCFK